MRINLWIEACNIFRQTNMHPLVYKQCRNPCRESCFGEHVKIIPQQLATFGRFQFGEYIAHVAIMFNICVILVLYSVAGFIILIHWFWSWSKLHSWEQAPPKRVTVDTPPKKLKPPFSRHFRILPPLFWAIRNGTAWDFEQLQGDPRSGLTCTGRPEEPLKRL